MRAVKASKFNKFAFFDIFICPQGESYQALNLSVFQAGFSQKWIPVHKGFILSLSSLTLTKNLTRFSKEVLSITKLQEKPVKNFNKSMIKILLTFFVERSILGFKSCSSCLLFQMHSFLLLSQ